MPIRFHKECRDRLVIAATDAARKVEVRAGFGLLSRSASLFDSLDEIAPRSGPIRNAIEEYVGENGISYFAFEYLSQIVIEEYEYDSSSEKTTLDKIDPDIPAKEWAERLVSELEKIPHNYKVTLPIQWKYGNYLNELDVGDLSVGCISLLKASSSTADEFSLVSGVPRRDDLNASSYKYQGFIEREGPKWHDGTRYVQIDVCGYIGGYGGTETMHSARVHVKELYGALIALGIVTLEPRPRSDAAETKLFVHREISNGWEMQGIHTLPTDTSHLLSCTIPGIFASVDGTEAVKRQWFFEKFSRLHALFGELNNSSKLRNACQWLFDSYSSDNELLAFVQATIVLEILLGDKEASDSIGLGVLLRNRCAYLIGSSTKERQAIISRFKDIYDVRSKIVHRGKDRITRAERRLLFKARDLGKRVIDSELRLLQKDADM